MDKKKSLPGQSGIKQKKKQFVIMAAITVAAVIALAVFATIFAYELPFTYDMTGQQIFTLSESTLDMIDGITEPVKIGAVYAEGNEDSMVSGLLAEYAKASELIEVEFIDAQNEPARLATYNLGGAQTVANGTIIVNSGDRAKLISDSDLFSTGTTGNIFYGEREFTGAIRFVSTDELAKVYFTTGHGETNISDLSEAVSLLALDAYDVGSLVLLQQGVPDDADVIIVAAPTSDLTPDELDMLTYFLDNGGKLMLMVDPILSASGDPLDNFNAIANMYGVDIANNYVYEEDSSYYLSVSNLYLIPRYGAHEITQQIGAAEKLVILPIVRGLTEIDYDKDRVTLDTLMISSAKSWARRDMTLESTAMADTDIQGPIALAFAASRASSDMRSLSSRAVIMGDSSFMVDGNVSAQANGDLLINSVNWLVGGRESEIIAGKVINSDTLMVRGSDFVKLAIICCAVIPLVMFMGAVGVWFLRRNK